MTLNPCFRRGGICELNIVGRKEKLGEKLMMGKRYCGGKMCGSCVGFVEGGRWKV